MQVSKWPQVCYSYVSMCQLLGILLSRDVTNVAVTYSLGKYLKLDIYERHCDKETMLCIESKNFQRLVCFLVQNFVLIHVTKKKIIKKKTSLIVWLKKKLNAVPVPGSSLLDALLLS